MSQAQGTASISGHPNSGVNVNLNCNSEANSLNDDHADKSADFQACKRFFHGGKAHIFSYKYHQQSSLFFPDDGWSFYDWQYPHMHGLRVSIWTNAKGLQERNQRNQERNHIFEVSPPE